MTSPRANWQWFVLILGIGILVLSGGCTIFGLLFALSGGIEGLFSLLPTVLMFGVPPILFGWWLVYLGRRPRRETKAGDE